MKQFFHLLKPLETICSVVIDSLYNQQGKIRKYSFQQTEEILERFRDSLSPKYPEIRGSPFATENRSPKSGNQRVRFGRFALVALVRSYLDPPATLTKIGFHPNMLCARTQFLRVVLSGPGS